MRLVDTCGWLEFFTAGPLADAYEPMICSGTRRLLVPTLVLYETYKFLRRTAGEDIALQAVTQQRICRVIDLDVTLALEAAELSLQHRLAMADAIVYATAQHFGAELVTSDTDLKPLPGVRFIPKKKRG